MSITNLGPLNRLANRNHEIFSNQVVSETTVSDYVNLTYTNVTVLIFWEPSAGTPPSTYSIRLMNEIGEQQDTVTINPSQLSNEYYNSVSLNAKSGKIALKLIIPAEEGSHTVSSVVIAENTTDNRIYEEIKNLKATTSTEEKEISASIYERIIDEIGIKNIALFVPAWEGQGDELSCIVHPELKFRSSNPPANMLGEGLLHKVPQFLNADEGFYQKPKFESTVDTGTVNLDATNTVLAQKLKSLSITLGLIRLKLNRVGTLSTATVKVSVWSGSTEPETKRYESNPVAASDINTTMGQVGFVFDNLAFQPNIKSYKNNWLVLEYDNSTGVDVSNYVQWGYDEGSDEYGSNRAVFSGTWAVTNDENMAFELYDDALLVTDDFTAIHVAKNEYPIYSNSFSRAFYFFNPEYRHHYFNTNGYLDVRAYLTGGFGAIGELLYRPFSDFNQHHIYASQFSKSATTSKFKGYLDGKLVADANGDAGDGYSHDIRPVRLGGGWRGPAGPFILTRNLVPADVIARVSNLLQTKRRLTRNV